MKLHYLRASIAALVIGLMGCSETDKQVEQQQPAMAKVTTISMEATVAAINHESREVTLKDADGKTLDITVSDDVKNLPQVEVGDSVTVEFLEAVTIEVLSPGQAEPGAGVMTAAGTAAPGERPAGLAAMGMIIVAEIESIDKENEMVTLKVPEGGSKTVKVRNPANLDKVAVGDKVRITYTRALAVNVSEKPASN